MEAQTLNNAAKHIFRLMQSFAQQKMIINNEIITIPNCKHCIVSLAISGVLNLTDNMVSVNENYL